MIKGIQPKTLLPQPPPHPTNRRSGNVGLRGVRAFGDKAETILKGDDPWPPLFS